MKIKRLFVPLGIVAVVLMSLTVLVLPDFGIVFAQDSRTATRTARHATRTALAIEYANAQSTYDAGLARLGSIRSTGTAYARGTAQARADGYARATANKIYVATANAVSDARSTAQAATQRVVAPLTATAGAQRHGQQVSAHQTRSVQTQAGGERDATAIKQAQIQENLLTVPAATLTARPRRVDELATRHASSQGTASADKANRERQWRNEEATQRASSRQKAASGNPTASNAQKTQSYQSLETEIAKNLAARCNPFGRSGAVQGGPTAVWCDD